VTIDVPRLAPPAHPANALEASTKPPAEVSFPNTHVTPLAGGTPQWATICATGGASSGFICPNQPSKVWGSGLVWDAADNYVMHFGGATTATGANKQETYRWANGAWTNLAPGTQPQNRANFTMVYDTADSYVFLFGGYITGAGTGDWGDSWKYVGGTWTKLSQTTAGLNARSGMCGVYVPLVSGHGGYVLMFGGKYNGSAAGNYPTDTWKFVGGSWTNITASVGSAPAGRVGGSCAYDSVDNYVVLFGGVGSGGTETNDVWKFDPAGGTTGTWTQLSANGAGGKPSARAYSELVYNSFSQKVVLSQGARGTIATMGAIPFDFWSYVGGTWTNQTAVWNVIGANPPAMYGNTVADVNAYGYSMYYGGMKAAGGTINGTFALGNILTSQGTASNPGEMATSTVVNFWNNVTGGSGTYTYVYHGLPTGCATTNSSHFTCTATTAGVFMVNCTTTDTGGQSTNSNQIKVVVDSSASVAGSLNAGTFLYNPPPFFFGADIWSNMTSGIGPGAVANLLNATPIKLLHFYGDFDKTNMSIGYQGQGYGSNGVAHIPVWVTYNMSNYRALCQFIGCTAWISNPSQTNDSGAEVAEINQWESRWGFTPAFLTMGVEISAWNHFNIPYTSWSGGDASTPTGVQYSLELQHMIPLIRAVDPNLKFLAQFIGGTVTNGSMAQWIQNISKNLCGGANGVQGVGLDIYPQQGNGFGNVNLYQFFNNLSIVSSRMAAIQGQVALGNAACTSIQSIVGENNAGNGGSSWAPYMQAYPDVPWVASAVIQSFLKQVYIYNTWSATETANLGGGNGGTFSMINMTTGATKPLYGLYSGILSHMSFGSIYKAPVTTAMSGIYSVEGFTPGNSILVDNTNTTVSLVFSPTNFPTSEGVTTYSDSQANGIQTAAYGPGAVPATFTIPPMGVLLLNQGTGTVVGGVGPGSSPIASPTNLTVTGVTFNTVSLAWSGVPTTATNVTVYWGPSCVTWASSAVLGPVTKFTVTGLAPINRYCFAVSASAPNAGNSPLSSTVTATTLPNPIPLPGLPFDSWKAVGGGLALVGFTTMVIPNPRRWLGVLLFMFGVISVVFL
jgi:hypothetical protein